MYDRGYVRNGHGWKTCLNAEHKISGKAFSFKYQAFDFKRRAIFIDEVSIKKAEHKLRSKTLRLSNEAYDADVIEHHQSSDDFSDGMM